MKSSDSHHGESQERSKTVDVPLTAQQIAEKRFTPVRLREGYSMEEVDHFLDEIQTSLKIHEEAGAQSRPASRSGLPVSMPAPEDPALAQELEATRRRLEVTLEASKAMELELERLRNAPQSTEAQLSSASAAAARTLEMAARQHDELIAAAEARRKEIMDEAQSAVAEERAAIEARMGDLDREEAVVAARIQELLAREEELRKVLVAKHSEALASLQAPSARVSLPVEATEPAAQAPALDASPSEPSEVSAAAAVEEEAAPEAPPLDVASNQFPSFYDAAKVQG